MNNHFYHGFGDMRGEDGSPKSFSVGRQSGEKKLDRGLKAYVILMRRLKVGNSSDLYLRFVSLSFRLSDSSLIELVEDKNEEDTVVATIDGERSEVVQKGRGDKGRPGLNGFFITLANALGEVQG